MRSASAQAVLHQPEGRHIYVEAQIIWPPHRVHAATHARQNTDEICQNGSAAYVLAQSGASHPRVCASESARSSAMHPSLRIGAGKSQPLHQGARTKNISETVQNPAHDCIHAVALSVAAAVRPEGPQALRPAGK